MAVSAAFLVYLVNSWGPQSLIHGRFPLIAVERNRLGGGAGYSSSGGKGESTQEFCFGVATLAGMRYLTACFIMVVGALGISVSPTVAAAAVAAADTATGADVGAVSAVSAVSAAADQNGNSGSTGRDGSGSDDGVRGRAPLNSLPGARLLDSHGQAVSVEPQRQLACTTTLHRSKNGLWRTGQYLHLQTTDAIIDITGYV